METPQNTRKCKVCLVDKNTNEYYICAKTIRKTCKECEKAQKKQYYLLKKDNIRIQQKQYYNSNRNKILDQKKSYYEENKANIIRKVMDKYKNDPAIKLYTHIRRRTRNFLKYGKIYSNIIQCSHDQLVKWFEFNFELDSHWEMNFNNFGEIWHIDHVYALSKVILLPAEQHEKYYSWQNLRPVNRRYNIAKSNKIIKMDLILIEIRIKLFLKQFKHFNDTSDLDNIPFDPDVNEDIDIVTLFN